MASFYPDSGLSTADAIEIERETDYESCAYCGAPPMEACAPECECHYCLIGDSPDADDYDPHLNDDVEPYTHIVMREDSE